MMPISRYRLTCFQLLDAPGSFFSGTFLPRQRYRGNSTASLAIRMYGSNKGSG